jgi:hypothetical protein
LPVAAHPLDPAIDLVKRTGIDGENVVAPLPAPLDQPLASRTWICFDASSVTRASLRETRNGSNLMATRRAACSCGQLHLTVEGEPSRISMCHCVECQRRTGAVISNQARLRREQITFNSTATAWKRTGESGNTLTCYFCPTCGSTVYFENEAFPAIAAVAIGDFADPILPAPTISVWKETRHP